MTFIDTLDSLKQWCLTKENEIQSLNQELDAKNKELEKKDTEIKELKKLLESFNVISKKRDSPKWKDSILYVCRDGKQRTSKEIFNEISKLESHPVFCQTPYRSCSAECGRLFDTGKLYKTNDSPIKYFVLLQ